MPSTYSNYAYQNGIIHSGLEAYILSEHLRSLGVEFDVYQTALDMSSTAFRLFLAIETATLKAFDKPIDEGFTYPSFESEVRQALHSHGLSYLGHITIGACDRGRLLTYLDELEGEKLRMFGAFGLSRTDREAQLPKGKTMTTWAKPLLDEIVAIVTERVKVTVVSKGRVIAMAQATGGEGQPLEVRRYKGGTEVDGVTLGECKLHKSGLMIIRKASDGIPADEKVTEVKNELTGHVVKLTATEDTTPKGEEREVKTVSHDVTLTLTGKDHKKSWIVSVEDEPEAEDS